MAMVLTMIVMWPINAILFWRLLKNDVFRYAKGRGHGSTKNHFKCATLHEDLNKNFDTRNNSVLREQSSTKDKVS